jgi:hypothetical protein
MLAEPGPGFFVPQPNVKQGHRTIDWKYFAGYAFIQQDDYKMLGLIRDNKHNFEPLAGVDKSGLRIETFPFFRLPSAQSTTFANQFVISASENDWIASDSVVILDKGVAYKEQDIPETVVENIAVALRKGSEIEPKSSPPASNLAPR